MAHDKKLHFIAGVVIAIVTGYLTKDVYCGLAWAILAGLAKEVYDLYDYGDFDLWDLAATCFGGALVLIVTEVLK